LSNPHLVAARTGRRSWVARIAHIRQQVGRGAGNGRAGRGKAPRRHDGARLAKLYRGCPPIGTDTDPSSWLVAPFVLPGDAEDDIVLVVSEAATNCVEHAYPAGTSGGTVELTFWTEAPHLCLEIVDHGTWRPPADHSAHRG